MDKAEVFVLIDENFARLPIFLLSDVRRKIAHKEPATLGDGLLS